MAKYSTEKIFEDLKKQRKDPPESVMYDETQAGAEKEKLRKDIENFVRRHDDCSSETDFIVNRAGITKSQYSRFMNSEGPKGLSRDSLLKIFIVLGYNVDYMRTLLHRFGLKDLYARDRRDYMIIKGIVSGKDLKEILEGEGMDTLWKESV